jgi:hypothetical protein
MCKDCWQEFGAPIIDSPAIREAARLAKALLEEFPTGGAMHIVVDDFNIDDEDIQWCLRPENALRGHLETSERNFGVAFLDLSVTERASALALSEGYWSCAPPQL